MSCILSFIPTFGSYRAQTRKSLIAYAIDQLPELSCSRLPELYLHQGLYTWYPRMFASLFASLLALVLRSQRHRPRSQHLSYQHPVGPALLSRHSCSRSLRPTQQSWWGCSVLAQEQLISSKLWHSYAEHLMLELGRQSPYPCPADQEGSKGQPDQA